MSAEGYTYREGLPERPARMLSLKLDARGYPVPYFVQWIDGAPDFRVVDPRKMAKCVGFRLCWLCGSPLGVRATFVIGPMCAVNRLSAEPPSHADCAHYAARACPFLILPKAKRREAGLDELPVSAPAGIMIARNPGVTLLWSTDKWQPFRDGTGLLFRLGEPLSVAWMAAGRAATRAEVLASIQAGLPALRAVATSPSEAFALGKATAAAMELVPGE